MPKLFPNSSLARLDRDRNKDGCADVVAFNQLNTLQWLFSFGYDLEIADLLSVDVERKFRFGNVDATDVVGNMNSVSQFMILDDTVGVIQSNRRGQRFILVVWEPPSADAAEYVNRCGGCVADKLDLLRHHRWLAAVGAVKQDHVGDPSVLRIDEGEGHAGERFGRPIGKDNSIGTIVGIAEHASGADGRRNAGKGQRRVLAAMR